jgi:hypothetical protein
LAGSLIKYGHMNDALKTQLSLLPDALSQSAPSIMQSMVANMQSQISRDLQLVNASYSLLLLKLSEPDLSREFGVALREAMGAVKTGAHKANAFSGGLSLSLELIDDDAPDSEDDFSASTAQFNRLSAHAKSIGVAGFGAFTKEVFLNALKEAFVKARIDSTEVTKLMPYARRALDAELTKVYAKLV